MIFWKYADQARNFYKVNDQDSLNLMLTKMSQVILKEPSGKREKLENYFDKFIETYNITFDRKKSGVLPASENILPSCLNEMVGTSLDKYVQKVGVGVSLVTCCMNRNENLVKALPSWLACEEISEVIIVDWSSDKPVHEYICEHGLNDRRVKVIRVGGQSRWILSYAFNIGFRAASYDKILKTDADIIVHKEFFSNNLLFDDMFISGDWRIAKKGQEHINGFFYVSRENLMKIKGFNEYITTYGWDDDDIYNRLEQSGSKRTHVDVDSIYHIPHDDSQRVGIVKDDDDYLNALSQSTKFKIRANRFIANVMPLWNKDRIFLPFSIVTSKNGFLELKQDGESIHYVPSHIRDDAEYYAAMELASWKVGLRAFDLDRNNLRKLLKAKPIEEITILDIEIAIYNQAGSYNHSQRNLLLKLTPKFAKVKQLQLKQFLNTLEQRCRLNNTGLTIACDTRDQVANILPGSQYTAYVPGWRNLGQNKIVTSKKFLQEIVSGETNIEIEINDDNLDQLFSEINSPLAPEILIRKDKLFIDAQHGLGNRLRAMASAAAIAKATERELVVIWEPDHHCECRLSDLYDYKGAVIEEAFATEAKAKELSVFNYMEIEDGAEKDTPIIITPGKDVYARSAYVLNSDLTDWDKENKFLRELIPTNQVLDLVRPFDVSNRVAVHVRMEAGKGLDHNAYDSVENWTQEGHDELHFWREKSHYSHFVKRIDQLIKEDPSVRIFLATDLAENYQAFEKYYGEKLAYLNRDVYDRSKEQIIYALADAMLLSGCNRLLGSTWSSFSEIAIRLSTTYSTVEMSGKEF